jgi:hypothetical protein
MEHAPDDKVLQVSKWTRCTLIGLVCPVFCFWQPYEEWMDNWYFITAMFAIGTFSVITNFPSLLVMMHTKPMYWSELIDNQSYDHLRRKDKYKFQKRFLFSTKVVVFLCAPAIFDYYLNQRPGETWWDVVLTIYVSFCFIQTLMSYWGSVMLWIMDHYKRKSQSRYNSPAPIVRTYMDSELDIPPLTITTSQLEEKQASVQQHSKV